MSRMMERIVEALWRGPLPIGDLRVAVCGNAYTPVFYDALTRLFDQGKVTKGAGRNMYHYVLAGQNFGGR